VSVFEHDRGEPSGGPEPTDAITPSTTDSAPPALGSPPGPALTPLQRKTLDALRRTGDAVVFDPDLVADIRTEMRVALDHFGQRLEPGFDLFITKHRIGSALDCEEHHLAPDEFEWKPATAKGQVAHRAIQLMLSWRGEPSPTDLVDEAMARLVDEDRGIGIWMAALGPADEADLRGMSIERVTKFVESFPPLDRRSNPVTEAAAQWPLEGPILLRARVDLMIGRPAGDESRKVIVDLKTGRPSPRHRQDLGFYALLETLARGVPPRKLATFYLDASEAQVEDVSERLLRSAVRRTLDGINAIVELEAEGRSPVRRPGSSCRWCPIADDCSDGQAYLNGTDPTDLDP
jgi:CRISPR/Cas system-associated exonuclease Cas4 (RecB family)